MAESITTLSLWRTSTYQVRTFFVRRSALKSIGKLWSGKVDGRGVCVRHADWSAHYGALAWTFEPNIAASLCSGRTTGGHASMLARMLLNPGGHLGRAAGRMLLEHGVREFVGFRSLQFCHGEMSL